MKKSIVLIMALASLFLIGCERDTEYITEVVYVDDFPPPVPQGVYSITGDDEVLLYWLPIDDITGDFDRYIVYRSDTHPDTGYLEIGQTQNDYFVDDDVVNGNTYYYAVSSLDEDDNLSDLSYENVFDTPRPEGFDYTIFDFNTTPNYAGWDLSTHQTIVYDNPASDFYLEYFEDHGVFYINVGNIDTDIQDMGYTEDLDEIGYSPENGWSLLGWSEVILGHTYIIWTADNHFAKIRVTAINATNIIFDWAYQVDIGNPELKPAVQKPSRPRPDNYLRTPEQNNKILDTEKITLSGPDSQTLAAIGKEGI